MPGFFDIYFLIGIGINAFIVSRPSFVDRTRGFWAKQKPRSYTSKLVIMTSALAASTVLCVPTLVVALIAGLIAGARSEMRRRK